MCISLITYMYIYIYMYVYVYIFIYNKTMIIIMIIVITTNTNDNNKVSCIPPNCQSLFHVTLNEEGHRAEMLTCWRSLEVHWTSSSYLSIA